MDEQKSKFDTLFESVINKPNVEEIIVEANTANPKNKRKKGSNIKHKLNRMKKDKPIEHQRRDMKLSRGDGRKRQNFVPIYKQILSQNDMPTARRILNIAKKSESGIWKLSKRQVLEIAAKYKFNIPTQTKRVKHLGSTGIVMWRKNRNEYYLVKFSKNVRHV